MLVQSLAMTAVPAPRRRDTAYRLGCALFLWLALALAGGASRVDEWQQAVVRLAAIVTIVAVLWPLDLMALRLPRMLVAVLALAWLVPLMQMLPLPPQMWAALPGHGLYARIAAETGSAYWRPLSLAPDLTLDSLLSLLPVSASLLAAAGLDGRGRRRLLLVVLGVAMASALLGLAQAAAGGSALHLYQQSSEDAPVGLFANRNHQAALLACALPFTAMGAIAALRRGIDWRAVLAGGMVTGGLLLFVLVLTGSRAGLALGLMGLIGAGATLRAAGLRLRFRRGWRGWAMLAAGAVLTAAVVTAGAWRGGAFERLAATDRVEETRWQILPPLMRTAQAFMPWGSGLGSFDRVYRQFEPDSLLSSIYLNAAHDEPLQLAIEGGVPVLAVLALFLLWWGFQAGRVLLGRSPARQRPMQTACLAATVVLMASSLVDYPLRTPLLGALFALACVELGRAGVADREEPRHGR
jgi:hypothetical protein